jgi:hypothetical protein
MKFYWFIWIPRALIILLALFMGLFSLDVFEMNADLWKIIAGFLIHNIPSILLLLTLWFTWNRPFFGGVFFVFLAALITIFFHTYEAAVTFLAFSVPPLVAGILFFLAHYFRPQEARPLEAENAGTE